MKIPTKTHGQSRAEVRHPLRRIQFFNSIFKLLTTTGLIISVLILFAPQVRATATLDPTFGSGGKVITGFGGTITEAVLVLPDGKIVVVGSSFVNLGTGSDFAVIRYNSDGSVDTSFGVNGRAIIDISGLINDATAAVLQPDGKIVIVGRVLVASPAGFSDFAIARINPNGSLDTSFGTGGTATLDFNTVDMAFDVGLQSTGKIVVIGYSTGDIVMARYNINGSLDRSFGSGGKVITDVGVETEDEASALAIQPDDKIILGGSTYSTSLKRILLRYDSTGHLDPSFGSAGIAPINIDGYLRDIVLQPDGKIVLAGSYLSVSNNFFVARFLNNGSVDVGFGTGGLNSTDFFGSDDIGWEVALRADGKIVVAGEAMHFLPINDMSYLAVVLYNTDGSLAGSGYTPFSGAKTYGRAVAIQPDGKVVVAGIFNSISGGITDVCLARYTSIFVARTAFDFDGDGKTDVSVYRPGGGSHWYDIRSSWFYPQPNQFDDVQFGSSGDVIVPGDYDGDVRTDYAVFRPSTGTWYTSLNPAINFGAFHWGQSGDIPVPGDYDGDGKTDHAVYRPTTGTWWVVRSSDGGVIQQPFGTSTDSPVIGDFDGDSKTDFAYVSVSGASLVWNVRQSSNSAIVTIQFGLGNDTPVPADYDGDGKTNIAVFRDSTGRWYTLLDPPTGYGDMKWGSSGDVPVPGDYDGDGKADLAVFRPSSSNWYILRSTDSSMDTARWGLGTDVPVPSAFIPH